MSKNPEIWLESHNCDYSEWFREKTSITMIFLAKLVDRMPPGDKESLYVEDLKKLIRTSVNIFVVTHGLESNFSYIEDADLIFNEGTIGLKKLANKYGIKIG